MTEDFSVLFKNEPSQYIWLSLPVLRRDYTAVEISDTELGHSRPMFWVVGDGYRTMFYTTRGLVEVLDNTKFRVLKVLGSVETKVEAGRLRFKPDPYNDWMDVGPITEAGCKPTDIEFEHRRKAHLRSKEAQGSLDDEERAILKKGLKDDVWSGGSSDW